MATNGGSAGLTGYDYQTWFVAYKLVDAYFKKNIKVQPEAQFVSELIQDKNGLATNNKVEKAIVDDVIIYENDVPVFYNIKYISPAFDRWKVSDLHNQGVLSQIVKQFKNNSKRKIVFVSQSSCDLFQKVFKQIKESPNVKGIKLLLGSQQNEKDYKQFKEYTNLTDSQVLKLSKIVEYERGYVSEEYKKIVSRNFKNEVTKISEIANSLYQLAIDASKKNKMEIGRAHV